ncbi:MAG: transcriptional regulator [Candidatus Sedimenticola sp. (ex Thyasira tokunagai)]
MPKLIRFPGVKNIYRKCTSGIYADITAGLFPKPVKIGRMSFWLLDEVEAVIDAYIAGKSQDEIRSLITQLHADRETRSVAV